MNTLLEPITSNFFLSSLYDVVKFIFSYLLARGLVDGVYMRWKWGGWKVLVQQGEELLTSRELAPAKAKMVLTDDNDLSVYLKGMVSPHAWLNIDICSKEARQADLLRIERATKIILIDVAQNPSSEGKKENSLH